MGCSGWLYRHWRGDFYPPEVPASRWLDFYTTVFDTVEINNSFYRLPEAATFEAWRRRAPSGFLFAVKASRYLTHRKKLSDPAEPIALFFERARKLGRKLGPVLYQLPPRWKLNLERLAAFLVRLPRGRRHVLEFRDPSWYDPRALALLERHGAALCLHDMPGSTPERRRVGPFVYARFHGREGRYGGRYPDGVLDDWAGWITEQLAAGFAAFLYFNNDAGGHAPRDAVRLRDRIAARGGRVSLPEAAGGRSAGDDRR